MKKIIYWPETQLKKFLYKKYLLEKDIKLAAKENDLDRVLRIVPQHSKNLFLKEIQKKYPQLLL